MQTDYTRNDILAYLTDKDATTAFAIREALMELHDQFIAEGATHAARQLLWFDASDLAREFVSPFKTEETPVSSDTKPATLASRISKTGAFDGVYFGMSGKGSSGWRGVGTQTAKERVTGALKALERQAQREGAPGIAAGIRAAKVDLVEMELRKLLSRKVD